MNQKSSDHSEQLKIALEDVRRIREVMDGMRGSGSLRWVLRPMFLLALPMAPVLLVFGVFGQLVLDAKTAVVLGVEKTTLLWVSWLSLIVITGSIKWSIAAVVSKRRGSDLVALWRKLLFELQYYRLLVVTVSLLVPLIALFVKLGQTHHVGGLVLLITGVVITLMPLVLPLEGLMMMGLFSMACGGASFFVYPEYPFYKIAVSLFVLMLWMGIVGLRMPKGQE